MGRIGIKGIIAAGLLALFVVAAGCPPPPPPPLPPAPPGPHDSMTGALR